jgi:Glycosyltransferase
MKTISVILFDMSTLGGIQLMTVDTLCLLVKNGFNVTLVTMSLSERFLTSLRNCGGNIKIKLLPKIPTVTFQMIYSMLYKKDESFSINMHGDIQPIASDIVYFHQFNIDYNMRSSSLKRIILLPQYSIRKRFIEELRRRGSLVLVNSSWTQAEAKYFWNLDAKILYPPVHTEKFRKIENTNRSDIVVTISRFSRDRGLDNVLKVAKKLEKIRFVIAGYLQDPEYFVELKTKKSENVELYFNVSEETKLRLLSVSKVYFNPTPYIEGFGISVVEGMSAGLIPVTRNKGGVIDFVPKEYMFNEINEALSKIDYGIKNWNLYSMRMMKELANRFSLENYEKNLLDILDKYL